MARNYDNLEQIQSYERGQKKTWYRGYGKNGWKYTVEQFIRNKKDKMHWRCAPMIISAKPVSEMPNVFYGRTLEEISKKLEEA